MGTGERGQRAARGLAIALVVLAGLTGTASAQQDGSGLYSLTIHRWLCPVDFASESYSACHENPLKGGVFIVDGPESRVGMTDPKGTLIFPNLASGQYRIQVLPYGDTHDPPRAFCSTGTAQVRDPLDRVSRDAFAAAVYQDLDCNWYEIPVSGTPSDLDTGLPVVVYRCGPGYGGMGVAMSDYPAGCAGVPDVAVTIAAEDGSSSVNCVTNPSGRCSGHGLPEHAVLTVDESTLPDGLVLEQNPTSVWFYTEYAAAFLIALPEGAAPRESDVGHLSRPAVELSAVECSMADVVPCDGSVLTDFRFQVWQPDNPGTLRAFSRYGEYSNTRGFGEGTLRIIGASPQAEPEAYVVAEVACSRTPPSSAEPLPIEAIPLPSEPGTIVEVREVPFTPGDAIRCDWYVVRR